jgi:hypothetical protein
MLTKVWAPAMHVLQIRLYTCTSVYQHGPGYASAWSKIKIKAIAVHLLVSVTMPHCRRRRQDGAQGLRCRSWQASVSHILFDCLEPGKSASTWRSAACMHG